MKLSTLAFAFTAASITAPAIAGTSSTPYMPIHDLDLEGKPLETPSCSDGWEVMGNGHTDKCKPINGKDLPKTKDNGNTSSNSQASSNSTSSSSSHANVSTTNHSSTSIANKVDNNISNFAVTNNNNAHFNYSQKSMPANSLSLNAITDLDGNNALSASFTHYFGSQMRQSIKKGIALEEEANFIQACLAAQTLELDPEVNPILAKCPKTKSAEILSVPFVPENNTDALVLQQAKYEDLMHKHLLMEQRLNQLMQSVEPIKAKG